MRVLAAMSGGVDSAVAAARVRDAGHEVVGVHLALSKNPETGIDNGRGCCTLSDARDARRSADIIGIPFYVWDMATEFTESVMADFIAEYEAGRTPNPCMRCNERIKFAAVLDRAIALGFDAVCTGHYARLVDVDGCRQLHRATDIEKDQSYVLAVLTERQLHQAIFPLGDSVKSDVRAEAAERGLLVANKPDSYDICFIPDGDTAGWLRSRLGERPGDIVDATTGETVGHHQGSYAYTIGQRRGLGVRQAPPDGNARYVVDIDVETNVVTLGPPTLLEVNEITAEQVVWTTEIPLAEQPVMVQVRAHGEPLPAVLAAVTDESVQVRTQEVIRGVATGQTLALYDGTRVIGSGTIYRTRRAT